MTTSAFLSELLCSDPVYGDVSRILLSGGSWYDADQLYWQIRQDLLANELVALLKGKPSKSAQAKVSDLLVKINETCRQLLETRPQVLSLIDAAKKWTPAPTVPGPVPQNAFAALAAGSDEE